MCHALRERFDGLVGSRRRSPGHIGCTRDGMQPANRLQRDPVVGSSIAERRPVGVRWTIGRVRPRGFDALRLSIRGVQHLFGPAASYAVCVNGVSTERVRVALGRLSFPVDLYRCAPNMLPVWLIPFVGHAMSDGMAWKLSPPRVFPDRFELSLDNDVILWETPAALEAWLGAAHPKRWLLAEDVTPLFGRFAPLCGDRPLNAGIRGIPPLFDLEAALRSAFERIEPGQISEADEQGLQVAAARAIEEPDFVSLEDVTVCSPFPPHVPHLGRCGAHFVGLKTSLPWSYFDRPADEVRAEHWDGLVSEVERRIQGITAAHPIGAEALT